MATYNPPSFPRRPSPKDSTLFSEIRYYIQLAYYRYEINTALYVMSPAEKLAYNLILFSMLALFVASVCCYFPYTVKHGFGRLGCHSTGTQRAAGPGMGGLSYVVLDRTVEAAQSLVQAGGGGPANASAALAP